MIQKITLRDEIKKVLLELMLSGSLIAGKRISLPQIAKRLDVSVTPVREALAQLTESGVVVYFPNRGFFIGELNPNEAMELYELIILLESNAVRTSSFSQKDIADIEECNSKFEQAKNQINRLKHDMDFHNALLEPSKNLLVKKIIDDIRIRIFFYELEYMEKSNLRSDSDEGHRLIIDLLRKKQNDQASLELANNWKLSIDAILSAFDRKAIQS